MQKNPAHHVYTQIELECPGGQVWSGFEFSTKPDQPGLSSFIRLEVIKDKRKILVWLKQTFPFGYQTGIKSYVCTHITSKRIELESPDWSGLVRF